jgi:hypothetical protein
MKCLRCSRDTAPDQVFCNACLDNMSRYPVKSDTPVYLPIRKPKEAPKKSSFRFKRERSPEELIPILRKRVRVLTALVVILVMMFGAAMAGVWIARKQGADLMIPNIGQNFKTITDIFDNPDQETEGN